MREKDPSASDFDAARVPFHPGEGICLLALGVTYVALGIYVLPYYRYQINPDGVSYITIAYKYLHGDFGNAINAYWGPMISWLLVPLLFFNLPALYAVKIQMLLVGLITLLGLRQVFCIYIKGRLRTLLLFPLVPVLLYSSVFAITPDLHLLCALVFYFSAILDPGYPSKVKLGMACGLFGGLAFLCKSFAFPFFILHFLLFNFFRYQSRSDSEGKKRIIRNCLWGFFVFTLISGPWVFLISHKYHTLTFGTAGLGAYRVALNPDMEAIVEGFHDPPNPTALSFHEDPTPLILETRPWHITDSAAHLKYYLNILVRNIADTLKIFLLFSPATYLFMGILFVRRWGNPDPGLSRGFHRLVLITLVLNVAGYLPVFVEERYLWISLMLLYGLGTDFMYGFYYRSFPARRIMILGMALCLLSFAVHPSLYLLKHKNLHEDVYLLSHRMKKELGIEGKIASNSHLHLSLAVCYHLGSPYFGYAKRGIGQEGLIRELKKYHIDYYFLWDQGGGEIRLPYPSREVDFPGMPHLTVYKVS
jgi:hypothetical protein